MKKSKTELTLLQKISLNADEPYLIVLAGFAIAGLLIMGVNLPLALIIVTPVLIVSFVLVMNASVKPDQIKWLKDNSEMETVQTKVYYLPDFDEHNVQVRQINDVEYDVKYPPKDLEIKLMAKADRILYRVNAKDWRIVFEEKDYTNRLVRNLVDQRKNIMIYDMPMTEEQFKAYAKEHSFMSLTTFVVYMNKLKMKEEK